MCAFDSPSLTELDLMRCQLLEHSGDSKNCAIHFLVGTFASVFYFVVIAYIELAFSVSQLCHLAKSMYWPALCDPSIVLGD
jgi:hypothetical protein